MRYGLSPDQQLKQHQSSSISRRQHFRWMTIAAVVVALAASAYAVQKNEVSVASPSDNAHVQTVGHLSVMAPSQQEDIGKYAGLLAELGRLQSKIQQEIQLPALRTQPKLLSQLPASTTIYVAFPNYGDSLHQAVQILHQELKENQTLRDGWQSFPASPMVEDALDKLYQFSQYLGNELVVSAEIKPKGGSSIIVAEIRKPGLSAFLQGLVKQFAGGPNGPVSILNPQQLLTAKAHSATQAYVLVRSDLLVVAFDLPSLKSFNTQLSRPTGKLASTPFGQRLAQAYQGGAGTLFGADLERLKSLIPLGTKKDEASFQQTGFADVKYLIAERKDIAGQTSNNAELTFSGPRHGIASWLASPAPIGGLDFVSTDAGFVSALAIKSPAQLLDDIKAIAKISNPDAETGLAQGEAALNMKLKDDLLSKIGKEITLSVDGAMSPTPPWKVILQVNDPNGLQQTLKKLLATASGFMPGEQQPKLDQQVEGGQTYYTLRFLSGQKPTEVAYAFADGYMVVAGSQSLVSEALRIHHNGTSLSKSSEFQAMRPQDHSADASGIFYQNLAPMLAPMVQQLAPEMAQLLQGVAGQSKPSATFVYGEENAIRVASNSRGADAAMVAIIAAVAIPNLMKARTSANEAGGASAMRTLNTAQVSYSATNPEKGYSPDLATLGPGSDGNCGDGSSKSHACLIDAKLGCASGTSGEWCVKNGFRYTITATCEKGPCTDYVIIGTPVDASGGGRNFCSTADAVVRIQKGPPLTSPITVSECQSWDPL